VDKGKQAQTPEMLEAQPVTAVSLETKNEAPFGIRAIQSGIEVDGVWISRSNTPVGSSRNSVNSEKLPFSQDNSQLELPQAAYGCSRSSSRAPSVPFDRAGSVDWTPNGSRSSSPGRRQSAAAPVRCSNCSHSIPQNHLSLQNLESPRSGPSSGAPSRKSSMPISYSLLILSAPNGRNGPSNGASKQSSRSSSDESDYMATQQNARPYESAYMRTSVIPRPLDPRTDLDLLQSHRMSHVAETGQLTPRVRRPGHSGEWASVAESQVATSNGVSYFVPQKTPSPSLPAIADPQEEAAAAQASTSTQNEHTPDEAKQGVPLMESYAPKAAYYPDTYQPRGPSHQFSYDQVPYEVQTEQNQRDSQVVRKVNSGFEILKPGTFAPPTPEELELAEQSRQSNKLQKKRRTSDIRQSAFVEQV